MRKLHLIWPVLLTALLMVPGRAEAHQPRLVTQGDVQVSNPTVSQAFYDELKGQPRDYYLQAEEPLELTIQLLVPSSTNPHARYSAEIYKGDEQGSWVAVGELNGGAQPWAPFHEEFANDDYLQSQEYSLEVLPGKYDIQVTGPISATSTPDMDRGKYVLVVGKDEAFPPAEIWNAIKVVPKLKKDFFRVSPLTLLGSKTGPYTLIMALLVNLLFWWILWRIIKSVSPNGLGQNMARNIGWPDRIIRLLLGAGLIVLSIHWWSLWIFLAGGFVVYQGLAGWCALYAALGRRTCPVS